MYFIYMLSFHISISRGRQSSSKKRLHILAVVVFDVLFKIYHKGKKK